MCQRHMDTRHGLESEADTSLPDRNNKRMALRTRPCRVVHVAAASALLVSALPEGRCKETKHCLPVGAYMPVHALCSPDKDLW